MLLHVADVVRVLCYVVHVLFYAEDVFYTWQL